MLAIDRALARRFLAAGTLPEPLEEKLEQACLLVERQARPRSVYQVLPLTWDPSLSLGSCPLPGRDMERALAGCQRAVAFALTLGSDMDALLRRLQVTDMTLAAMADACASAATEQCCDALQDRIAGRLGLHATDRYSPGYGDFPLASQGPLTALLNAEKAIGLTLTPHLLMVPTKSVSAVFGLSDRPVAAPRRGCQNCSLSANCPYGKENHRCESSQ